MASVIKQADPTSAQLIAKIKDCLLHGASIGVEQAVHLKA